MIRFAAACVAVAVLSSSATAAPATVKATVNLRSAPANTSEVVARIPGGSRVDADKCENEWCAVTWQGKSGYTIKSALNTTGAGRAPVKAAAPVRRIAPAPYDEIDEVAIAPAFAGPPVIYPYPYRYRSYRPYGYYRYGGYYRGYRYGGWRRRW